MHHTAIELARDTELDNHACNPVLRNNLARILIDCILWDLARNLQGPTNDT